MLRSSLPIGRYFGIDLRLHISFPILLLLAIGFSVAQSGSPTRGIALWLALVLAVLVREVARTVAATYAGLRLRTLFLLPVGGIMAFAPSDGRTLHTADPAQPDSTPSTRWITVSGPVANFALGLLMLAFCYALDPTVSLLDQPWIDTAHILRSVIWMQLVLGAISLLPTPTMPSRQLLRQRPGQTSGARIPLGGVSFGLSTVVALALILAGFAMPTHFWLIIVGAFMLLGAQLANAQHMTSTDAEAILVSEVMLTEYAFLSSSDTLQQALDTTIHSLQDVFPVVRGNRLVGSIARHTIAERLLAEGDSYLQGIMVRTLQLAEPTEKLAAALRRAASLGTSEFIPVVQGDSLVGILTPQSLTRAVQQVNSTRPVLQQRERQQR